MVQCYIDTSRKEVMFPNRSSYYIRTTDSFSGMKVI